MIRFAFAMIPLLLLGDKAVGDDSTATENQR
jgi:hypothetical protein